MIDHEAIESAKARLGDAISRSPCRLSETLSRISGLSLYLKLENLQRTGSFKERGALNKLLAMTADERSRGVIAASAGNHGQALAYHAARLGVRCLVVMPEGTPLIKVVRTREHGAEVVLFGDGYDAAFDEAQRRARTMRSTFVHPFDDEMVIAGQATLGLELLEQQPDLDAIFVPVGGGGLAAGLAFAAKNVRASIRVIGVQAERFPSAIAALEARHPVLVPNAQTLAEGIAVRRTGTKTYQLMERFVDDFVTVSEEEIASAILLLLEREKTVAEGAGAAALAAAVAHRVALPTGARAAAIVSGGNIDVNTISRIIERALVQDDRLLRLEVTLPDVPGALHTLLGLIAESRANVLQITHDRALAGARLGESIVDITLESRGTEHVLSVLDRLRKAGYAAHRVGAPTQGSPASSAK